MESFLYQTVKSLNTGATFHTLTFPKKPIIMSRPMYEVKIMATTWPNEDCFFITYSLSFTSKYVDHLLLETKKSNFSVLKNSQPWSFLGFIFQTSIKIYINSLLIPFSMSLNLLYGFQSQSLSAVFWKLAQINCSSF